MIKNKKCKRHAAKMWWFAYRARELWKLAEAKRLQAMMQRLARSAGSE